MWTTGHGTRPVEDLIEQLQAVAIERLVDVRTAPGSRRSPQYGRGALAAALSDAGVRYEWRKDLGGFRRPSPASPNRALRNQSFRGYADHMATEEFRSALAWLEATARAALTVVMCAESVWWRCHRRMIADALLVDGWTVFHLMPDGRAQRHRLHPEARVENGMLIYDAGTAPLDVGGD